jgi:hypothetical protein
MFLPSLRKLLRQSPPSSPRGRCRPNRRRADFRPRLEVLEDRLAPVVDTWTGANHAVDNNWSDAANWSLGHAPGSGDIANFTSGGTQSFTSNVDTGFAMPVAGVTIDGTWGGTINVNSNLAVTGNFSMASGTLAGPANVTVSGLLTWSGGTMSGAGHTQANGGMTLNSGNYLKLDGRTIDNAGVATWTSGGANIAAGNGAVWNNLAGSTLDLHGDDPFYWNGAGALPQFNNAGTLEKSSGSNSSRFDPILVNNIGADNGTVKVLSGDLNLDGGDSGASHGSFSATAGNTLTFGSFSGTSTFTLSTDSSVSGDGTVQILGTTVNVTGAYTVTATTGQNSTTTNGIANFSSNVTVNSLTLTGGGTLTGTGDVTVSKLLKWDVGAMSGTGSTTVAPSAVLDITGTFDEALDARTINNQGTVTWTGGGNVVIGTHGAVINNEAGAVWDFQKDAAIVGVGTFNNAGTLQKSAGSNSSRVDPTFVNNIATANGTVKVLSGDLSFDGGDGGASHGSFSVTAGNTLTFIHNNNLGLANDSFTLSSDSSASGAGTMQIVGVTVNVTGGYSVTATTVQDGNTTTGIANFRSNVTLSSLTLKNGGTLAGTANVTVSGRLDWNAGTMTGTGSTTVAPTATLAVDGGFDETLDTRTLNNKGTATWTGDGNVIFQNGAVINNSAGATWDFQSDAGIVGATGTFNNAGTVKKTKTKGSGPTKISPSTFNNTGRLEVHAGTVNVTATVSQVSGSTLTAGSWLAFGSATTPSTLTITLAGSLTTIGTKASVTLSGLNSTFTNFNGAGGLNTILAGGSFSVLGGQSFTTAGNLSNAGSVILSSGTLTVTGAVAQLSGTSLTGGTWTVGASSNLNFVAGSNITSLAGANVTLSGSNSNFAALANLDTVGSTSSFSLLGGRSFTTAGNLTNSGKVILSKGTLNVAGNLSDPGSVSLTSSTLKVTGAVAQLSGTSLTGGTWTVGANSNLNFAAGSHITALAGANVTLSGSNSNFAALANLDTVGSTSSFSLLGGRSFTTAGALTNGGSITLSPGSVLTVSGSFTHQSGASLNIQMGGTANAPTIGTIVSTSGTVTLGGSLNVTSTVKPNVGTSFDILMNGGNSPISGNFAGLPEGQPFMVKVGSTSMTFTITYKGGAGNDVVITRKA